ncbi:hypothetical protein QR98_0044790 [Sarcoptes scabiei]|uniref:Small integral membrane protein 15 n=1 Tax=Sarcoptes scabiei TaxID=52283 RepID=A0A132A4S4_SARSC|nr:hypothetical protein QR98_0044790 [Sarcoptes scabiei]
MLEKIEEILESISKYAAENSSSFLIIILFVTIPMFVLSAFLSLRLAKNIEVQKKRVKNIEKIKEKTKKKQ